MSLRSRTRAGLSLAASYARFSTGLPAFLRQGITPAEAGAAVAARFGSRTDAFLDVVRRALDAGPESPYPELFRLAGCGFDDVAEIASDRGVEGALDTLRRAGVYVTFEEFKGRQPIVRRGREIRCGPRGFDSRPTGRFVHGATSGSSGPAIRAALDLDHLQAGLPAVSVMLAAHGVYDAPSALWLPGLPSLAGVSIALRSAARGCVAERWFSPLAEGDLRRSAKDRIVMETVLLVSRLAGTPLPRPRAVEMERAEEVARWAAGALERRGVCLLHAHVSGLLRVALAARDLGIDLTGAVLCGGGEPATDVKLAAIAEAGARFVPTYFTSEAGAIGLACAEPRDPTDVHLLADSAALIQAEAPPSTGPGASLFLTGLHPAAARLLVNLELDDEAEIEERPCGCPFGKIGLRRHLRHIASRHKLTGEGMSIVASDVVRLVEEVLPARFGGSPLDYQLVEEEDDRGLTRLKVLVHPRLRVDAEEDVLELVLGALAAVDVGTRLAVAWWRRAGAVAVERRPPALSQTGKCQPLIKRRGASLARPVRPAAREGS